MAETSSVNPVAGDQAFLRDDYRGTHSEAMYAGALSFMRRRYTRDLTGVDVAVLGIPFDSSVSNRPGTRLGPRGVRAASAMARAMVGVSGWVTSPMPRRMRGRGAWGA